MSHVTYLNRLTPAKFNDTVERMAALIQDKFPACNTIFGRGLSSTMLLPALAAKLNVEWAIVRKDKNTHSSHKVEASKWRDDVCAVFVDDLIDSGESFRASLRTVIKATVNFGVDSFKCLGAACYDSECDKLSDYETFYM